MGNAGSTSMHRERHKSSDISTPNSPFRELPLRGEGGSTAQGIAAVSGGQAFTFDKKRDSVIHGGSSQEDDETTSEPYYTKPIGKAAHEQQQQQSSAAAASAVDPEFSTTEPRKRSSTISEGTTTTSSSSPTTATQIMSQHKDNSAADSNDESQDQSQADEDSRNPALPTVLRWDGGGQNVMISGTFTQWKPIPMVRSHGNFVTIIDLPEGDHQYKFCVDGEWKHDPKLVNIYIFILIFCFFIFFFLKILCVNFEGCYSLC